MSGMPFDFMPMPDEYSSESSNRKSCISFFMKLFSVDEMRERIRQFSPEKIMEGSKSITKRKSLAEILKIDQINDHEKLAELLYDIVGPHFLYEVQGAKPEDRHSKAMRHEVFKKAIDLGWFNIDTVSKAIASIPKRDGKGITNLDEIMNLRVAGPWQTKILELLSNGLPSETVEMPSNSESKKKTIETITSARELLPLHDYQIFAGKKIRDLLTAGRGARKRLLVSIPTGAGKTRLVAESIIDWLNDGKPSNDLKIHKSKYIVWIAQSRELCEQAISQFQEIYVQKGVSSMTIFRMFGKYNISLETILSQRVEHGLIVCTIDKIYEQITDKQNLSEFKRDFFQENIEYDERVQKSEIPRKFYEDYYFGNLRNTTSCVIVDEAHKAIMPMYTCVLRGLGFNFSFKDELKCNESGIVLVGLTATAFRGTGLERSREIVVGRQFENKVRITFIEHGYENNEEVDYPINCAKCKKPISEGERAFQSTSERKTIWHTYEEKLNAETTMIYSRFSEPLIPRIHGFIENKKPKAIISCNDKAVAKDPILISGKKSYDSLGEINRYEWIIERKPNLIQVFGIKNTNEKILHPKPLPAITEEFEDAGYYKITLTVENHDGMTDTATKIIEVIDPNTSENSDEMKDLIQNLIKREILCEVFHTTIKSERFDVYGSDKDIDFGDQIRKKAAESDERNEKLVKIVHYLLTVPEEKRKKILVFACDIMHARFLAMYLKTKYGISAEYVDSNLHESRNIARIRSFREKSDNGKVLINTNMLTTGFDVPDIDCVVMGRPVISTVEYTQMIGRGMRGPRMGGTSDVWIIDFDDQVQQSKMMRNQTITLGWKSMAYDNNGKLVWIPLSEKKDSKGNSIDLDTEIKNVEDQSRKTAEDNNEKTKIMETQQKSEDVSPNERLRLITGKMIDELAYIPAEDEFRERIGKELYDVMLETYVTYNTFLGSIGINEIIKKLVRRSDFLNRVMIYYNTHKKIPDVANLVRIIPDFNKEVSENFKTVESFLKIIQQIGRSVMGITRCLGFEEIKKDYDFVDSKTVWPPTTEQILLYSEIGIGQYMKYAGTVGNFQKICELNNDSIRVKLEEIKHSFFQIKKELKITPNEEMMKKFTNYAEIIDNLWFDNYEKFLEFLGEESNGSIHNSSVKDTKEIKSEKLNWAKGIAKVDGMTALFEKIVLEPDFTYDVYFGSKEKFIECVFPDIKHLASIKWLDIKKKFQAKQ